MDARSDLASRVIMGVVFAYFSVSFLFGWAYLISALVQVATFLLLGGIKFMQSRYFVKEDLRKRTVRQINFMQKFKCDKGLASIKEVKEESGLDVIAEKIIAVQDRAKHNLPRYAYGICKIFIFAKANRTKLKDTKCKL